MHAPRENPPASHTVEFLPLSQIAAGGAAAWLASHTARRSAAIPLLYHTPHALPQTPETPLAKIRPQTYTKRSSHNALAARCLMPDIKMSDIVIVARHRAHGGSKSNVLPP